jgi:hypothetical protein
VDDEESHVNNRILQLLAGGLVVAGVGMASVVSAQPAAAATPPNGVPSVNCGKVGPVGGKQVDLIAVSRPHGRVGCVEAIDVVSDYYSHAREAQGTARRLVVDGWTCQVTPTREVACDINNGLGLAFHTTPA